MGRIIIPDPVEARFDEVADDVTAVSAEAAAAQSTADEAGPLVDAVAGAADYSVLQVVSAAPVAGLVAQEWDPVVTQGVTVGMFDSNGHGAYVSQYWSVGDLVFFQYMAQVDTDEAGTADNAITVTLPVNMAADYNTYNLIFGTAWIVDSSDSENNYPLMVLPFGVSQIKFLRTDQVITGFNAAGTTAGGGLTLAQNDGLRVQGYYLPA